MKVKNIVYSSPYLKDNKTYYKNEIIGAAFFNTQKNAQGQEFETINLKFQLIPVDFNKGNIQIMDKINKNEPPF